MTRPVQVEPPAPPVRRIELTQPVDLVALADEIGEFVGRPVVLGSSNAPSGIRRLTVRDAETGAEIDGEGLRSVIALHVPPTRVTPAQALRRAAQDARTVAELANAIVAYTKTLEP